MLKYMFTSIIQQVFKIHMNYHNNFMLKVYLNLKTTKLEVWH